MNVDRGLSTKVFRIWLRFAWTLTLIAHGTYRRRQEDAPGQGFGWNISAILAINAASAGRVFALLRGAAQHAIDRFFRGERIHLGMPSELADALRKTGAETLMNDDNS
jgi:hypothetical protein